MNPTLIVMRKELKELFRDRRVRNNAIVMPAFIMLLMLTMFGFVMNATEKSNQVVHVVNADNTLVERLRAEHVKVVQIASIGEGEKLIRSGKARLVLEFEPDFDAKVKTGRPTPINAYFDPQQDTGKLALRTVQEDMAKIDAASAVEILRAHGLSPQQLTPASVVEKPIKVGTSETNELLIGLLPYLIVVYSFVGGFASGGDLVAGEKDKFTLETLLIAPVGRSQIAFGKFLSLATVCLISSLSALAGVVLAGVSKIGMYNQIFPKGLGLTGGQFGIILLVLVPTVAFFASLVLAVSTFAKNAREAQSYLAIVSLIVFMPAVFGQVIGLTDLASNQWVKLIPVLNTSLSVREALQGKVDGVGLLMTVGVGAVLAFIGIRVAVNMFKREQVLTRV